MRIASRLPSRRWPGLIPPAAAPDSFGLVPGRTATNRRRFKRRAELQTPCAKAHDCTVLNIPTATLCVSIATLLVTGYIAWQQWQTAKNKFRLDLFDRRFPAFKATMKLAVAATHKGEITQEELREFDLASEGAAFLFDQKIEDYCRKIGEEAFRLSDLAKELSVLSPGGDEHTKCSKIWIERKQWFEKQVYKIPKLFAPYLRIRG